jgi:SAM-dependent methyltransferase
MSAENPWLTRPDADDPHGDRGAGYAARLAEKEAEGQYLHAEADLVQSLLPAGGDGSVIDAGCGTGRVAIELARRGVDVIGTDLDPSMLAVAREQAPDLRWVQADLSTLDLGRTVDVVVAAGNVMVFLTPGTEADAVARMAAHLRPGGFLVAGFALRDGPSGIDLDLSDHDAWCAEAGLSLHQRLATWEGEPYQGGTYAVSIHRRR